METVLVGQKFLTKEGYWIDVIDEVNNLYSVRFLENGFILNNISFKHIHNGTLKNPFHPSVFGMGYIGVGKYTSTVEKELTRCYEVWQMMIGRCYCPIIQKRQPTYKGVTMVEEWHNFQNFAKWFYENYVDGFDLNKNILIQDATMYSPETCCFVPKVITNTLLVRKNGKSLFTYPRGVRPYRKDKFLASIFKLGVFHNLGTYDTVELAFAEYKKAKELHIQEFAKEWKPKLKPNTYEALMKYEVKDYD